MKHKIDFTKIIKKGKQGKEHNITNNEDYFSLVARNIVLPLRYIFALGYSHPDLYRVVFGFETKYTPFYDSWKNIFIDKNEMEYEKENIINILHKDKYYLEKIGKQCEKDSEELDIFCKTIKQKDLSKINDGELKEILTHAFNLMVRLSSYLLFPISIQSILEKNVLDEIKNKIKNKKLIEEYYSIFSVPSKRNIGYYEQLNFLKLALMYKDRSKSNKFDKKLKKYCLLYGSQGVKFGYGKLWTEKDVKERLKFIINEGDLSKKIKRLSEIPSMCEEKIKKTLKHLSADDEFSRKVDCARFYMYIRTLRTDILSSSFANLFPLFKEIGGRHNLKISEVVECTPDELITFKFPTKQEIKKKAKSNIVRGMGGFLFFQDGTKAKLISQQLENQILEEKSLYTMKYKNEFRGNIANKGKVRGNIKIINDNSQLSKLKEGDILVTSMTTPDLVPVMEKAAAFVTDEGGLLCHAAILSREFGKPCITGTRIATTVLKDGDLVEVDANKGIVRILIKANNKIN